MKKHVAIVFFLFLIASLLRFPKLSTVPNGMQWDEMGYAYNAYSIIETGKDEWGRSFPLFLKSFGDVKPALLSYLIIPSFKIFGVNEFAARFPTALLGVLSVIAFYGINYLLSKNKKLSFVGAIILAITPWHIHYSKIAFDPMISLSFLLIGLFLFIAENKLHKFSGAIFLFLSMYTYNAARFFVPLIVLAYIIIFKKNNYKKFIKSSLIPLSTLAIGFVIIAGLTFFSTAGSRAKAVFFWDPVQVKTEVEEGIYRDVVLDKPFIRLFNNKPIYLTYKLIRNYTNHFSYDYLFANTWQTPAFAFSKHGHLLLIFLPLILIGVFSSKKDNLNKFYLFWLLVSPIASTLTKGDPNANRSLIMVPAIAFFVAQGVFAFSNFGKKKITKRILFSLILIIIGFNTILYVHDYSNFFPEDSAPYSHSFYKKASREIYAQKDQFSKIYFTNTDAQPYIFIAWYNLMDPTIVQKNTENRDIEYLGGVRELDNFRFIGVKRNNLPCLLLEKNVLVVASSIDGPYFANKVAGYDNVEILPKESYYHADRFHPEKTALELYDSKELSSLENEYLNYLCSLNK